MSRFRHFVAAVASGYVSIAGNTLYTLLAIPIALHYLSTDEFGIWMLALQITVYVQCLDVGTSSSIPRILIDFKDRRSDGRYTDAVWTCRWVQWIQSVVVFGAGCLIVLAAAPLLRIPPSQAEAFVRLAVAQVLVFAAGYSFRIYSQILAAHQRLDCVNLLQTAQFAVNLLLLWVSLLSGLGLLALPVASFAAALGAQFGAAVLCRRWAFLPDRGGRVLWPTVRELLTLSWDSFLMVLGSQLITSFQPFLITRYLGLAAAATWSVCTKLFTFASQMAWRFFDSALPALGEMMTRGEMDRLRARYGDLARSAAALGAVCAAGFAIANGSFVQVWTHGRISWAPANDYLLAVWLLVLALFHAPGMLILTTKRLQAQGYVYVAEGAVSLAVGAWVLPRYGMPAMIAAGIACSLCFHGPYVMRRVCRYLNLPPAVVAFRWSQPALGIGAFLLTAGALLQYGVAGWPVWPRLLALTGAAGAAGAMLLWRFGMSAGMRAELGQRIRAAGRAPFRP